MPSPKNLIYSNDIGFRHCKGGMTEAICLCESSYWWDCRSRDVGMLAMTLGLLGRTPNKKIPRRALALCRNDRTQSA